MNIFVLIFSWMFECVIWCGVGVYDGHTYSWYAYYHFDTYNQLNLVYWHYHSINRAYINEIETDGISHEIPVRNWPGVAVWRSKLCCANAQHHYLFFSNWPKFRILNEWTSNVLALISLLRRPRDLIWNLTKILINSYFKSHDI